MFICVLIVGCCVLRVDRCVFGCVVCLLVVARCFAHRVLRVVCY